MAQPVGLSDDPQPDSAEAQKLFRRMDFYGVGFTERGGHQRKFRELQRGWRSGILRRDSLLLNGSSQRRVEDDLILLEIEQFRSWHLCSTGCPQFCDWGGTSV